MKRGAHRWLNWVSALATSLMKHMDAFNKSRFVVPVALMVVLISGIVTGLVIPPIELLGLSVVSPSVSWAISPVVAGIGLWSTFFGVGGLLGFVMGRLINAVWPRANLSADSYEFLLYSSNLLVGLVFILWWWSSFITWSYV
jgi:NhaP-type Na+/H+ and K+/H+ antiporter